MASCKATDAVYKADPPSAGKKLRELFYCAHMIHSHIAHFYALAAPDFVLTDLEGGRFYLSAQKGKVILLNFWSVHCVPCLQEMPLLQKLQEDYSGKGASVIGICTDPGEAGYIDSFLKGLSVTYPVLMDTENKVSSLYNIHALPATYIIDQQGMIQYNTTGYTEGYVKTYISKLDELLRGK